MLTHRKPATAFNGNVDIPVTRHVFNKSNSKYSSDNKKTTNHFIKGPLPFEWIHKAASIPGKSLAVGISLWYLRGLTKSQTFKITAKARKLANCTRQTYNEGLRNLAKSELIILDQQSGRSPIVTLLFDATFKVDHIVNAD